MLPLFKLAPFGGGKEVAHFLGKGHDLTAVVVDGHAGLYVELGLASDDIDVARLAQYDRVAFMADDPVGAEVAAAEVSRVAAAVAPLSRRTDSSRLVREGG